MAQLTISVKGRPVTFETPYDADQNDKVYLALKEQTHHSPFEVSLLQAFRRNGWSYKQADWARYLLAQKMQETHTGEYDHLVKIFNEKKGNAVRFSLRFPGLILSANRYGGIYIKTDQKQYLGKITPNGQLKANLNEDELNMLKELNENENAMMSLAKVYGHTTGCCSVCGRTLTDKISIQNGIGPICQEKIG